MTTNSQNINSDRQEALAIFQEITQINETDVCTDILNQHNWNVDSAVEAFISNRGGNRPQTPNRGANNDQNQNDFSQVLQNNSSNNQGSNGFIDTLMHPIKWLFQTHPLSLNPDLDARNFKVEFDMKYNSNHPTFCELSYSSAVREAYRGPKFLLVYLHSPPHEDTNRFCRQVLCSQSVSRYVNDYMTCWAGKIWDAEAYALATQLRATAFPFLALLVCQSERTVQIVDRIQGYMEERQLLERLQSCIGALGSEVERMRQEATMREQSTRLREEQDREYRESMEADRLARERREREEEERERKEEEERQRVELEDAVQLSQKLAKESSITRARQALTSEPSITDVEIATIRFQLPHGVKIVRRFRRQETVEMVSHFLKVYFNEKEIHISNFSMCTNYPKRQLEDFSLTVEEAGLYPKAMLFIQDLDA